MTPAGDVASSTNPVGTTTYAWHEASPTKTTTAPGGLRPPSATTRPQTSSQQVTPNSGTTAYQRRDGRPATIVDPSGLRTAITYDASGQSVLFDDGSGAVVRQQFDAFNRLIRQSAGDGQNLMRF